MSIQIHDGTVKFKLGVAEDKEVVLTVSLTQPEASPVTVHVFTTDIAAYVAKGPTGPGAVAGKDYDAKQEIMTFAPGETEKQFPVMVHATTAKTQDKYFLVYLDHGSIPISRPVASGIITFRQ